MNVTNDLVDLHEFARPELRLAAAGWYATPLDAGDAHALLSLMRQAEQRALAAEGQVFGPRLGVMITGYWLGRAVEHDHRSLRATVGPQRQAWVDLIYGQLLIACKRDGAHEFLDRGFAGMIAVLGAAEYFTVLKRHALLKHLVLSKSGAPARALADLLTEAKIIKQLNEKERRSKGPSHSPDDTLG